MIPPSNAAKPMPPEQQGHAAKKLLTTDYGLLALLLFLLPSSPSLLYAIPSPYPNPSGDT